MRDDWLPRWGILVPLAILACYVSLLPLAFPQDDDVWFGWLLRERGFIGMHEHLYRVLAGRLFSNTVIVVPYLSEPLGVPLLAAYRALCALVLLGTIGLAFWMARVVMPFAGRSL